MLPRASKIADSHKARICAIPSTVATTRGAEASSACHRSPPQPPNRRPTTVCAAGQATIVSKPYFKGQNYGSLGLASHGGKVRCEPESMAWIAPSLLAADFTRLAEALDIVKAAGASMVHVDVMDGHFTPDITVGQPVIASLRKATDLVLDVHLLIERPERYVADFVEAGTDRL